MLDFYYGELLRALVEYGAAGGPEEAAALLPREALQEQYETAVLDMCRVVFAYQVRRRSSQHRAWAGEGHGLTGKKRKVGAAQRFAGQPGKKRNVARAELVQQVGAARVLACPAVRRPPPRARRAGGSQWGQAEAGAPEATAAEGTEAGAAEGGAARGGQQQPQADHGGAPAHARGPDEDPQFSLIGDLKSQRRNAARRILNPAPRPRRRRSGGGPRRPPRGPRRTSGSLAVLAKTRCCLRTPRSGRTPGTAPGCSSAA